MQLWQYNAYIRGYQAHIRELLSISVFNGYYAGYYNPLNKSRKGPVEIIKSMFGKHRTARNDEVDFENFRALEQAFKERAREKGVVKRGAGDIGQR